MCLALMGPGDTAIVPAPYFPVHVYAVALAAGNVIALEVADSEKFLSNIAYTCQHLYPKPKLLIVNYPHNPSTVTVEPEFYVEVVKLARRYGFMVISDFAYADVAFDGYQPPSFLAAPGAQRRGRRVHDDEQGLQHGRLAGRLLRRQRRDDPGAGHDQGLLRLRHVPADPDRRHRGPAAHRRGRRGPSAPVSAPPRRAVRRACDASAGTSTPPRAGMFVWAKIPEPWASQMDTMDFAMKLLEEGDVAVSPGSGFGPAGEGYLRMALVENENRLRQAVRQIGRCLGSESRPADARGRRPASGRANSLLRRSRSGCTGSVAARPRLHLSAEALILAATAYTAAAGGTVLGPLRRDTADHAHAIRPIRTARRNRTAALVVCRAATDPPRRDGHTALPPSRPHSTIVDVGCGTGANLAALADDVPLRRHRHFERGDSAGPRAISGRARSSERHGPFDMAPIHRAGELDPAERRAGARAGRLRLFSRAVWQRAKPGMSFPDHGAGRPDTVERAR